MVYNNQAVLHIYRTIVGFNQQLEDDIFGLDFGKFFSDIREFASSDIVKSPEFAPTAWAYNIVYPNVTVKGRCMNAAFRKMEEDWFFKDAEASWIWDKIKEREKEAEAILPDLVPMLAQTLEEWQKETGEENEYADVEAPEEKTDREYRDILIRQIEEYTDLYLRYIEADGAELHEYFQTETYRKKIEIDGKETVLKKYNEEMLAEAFLQKYLVPLEKARENFDCDTNVELTGTWDLNRNLWRSPTPEEKYKVIKEAIQDIYEKIYSDAEHKFSFRDFIKIEESVADKGFKPQLLTSFFRVADRSAYAKEHSRFVHGKIAKRDKLFYFYIGLFLALPTSREFERFMNKNGQSLLCPTESLVQTPYCNIYTKDVLQWIDCGVSYKIILAVMSMKRNYELDFTRKERSDAGIDRL